ARGGRAAGPPPAADAWPAGAAGGGDAPAPAGTPPAAGPTGAAGPAAPASPGAKISAIVLPTGTTSPARAVTSRKTPEAGASISTVTLSVSISTIGSPFLTACPGALSHFNTLPFSCR